MDAPARLTLQEEHIQANASLLKDSFQPHVRQIIQETFHQHITIHLNSIAQGMDKFTSLQKEDQELKTRNGKIGASVDRTKQSSIRNCFGITGILETENESTNDIVIKLATVLM